MPGKSPADPSMVRVPSVHTKLGRRVSTLLLVLVGLGLTGLATALWLADGSPPNSVTIKRTATRPFHAKANGQPTKSHCKCKVKRKTVVKTTAWTRGGGPSKRSETLVLALFGLGGLFILCGVFFGRIQEVTLPGGAGLKLTEEAQAQIASKVVDAAEKNTQLDVNAETIGRLYEKTLDSLLASHQQPTVAQTKEGFYVVGAPVLSEIPDEKVEQAAEQAADELTS